MQVVVTLYHLRPATLMGMGLTWRAWSAALGVAPGPAPWTGTVLAPTRATAVPACPPSWFDGSLSKPPYLAGW